MTNLISGKDALIALANGEDVEYLEDDNKWNLIDKEFVVISALIDCKLRLKPQTITINGIVVPAPFEPNHGDEIWFLNPDYGCGYADGDYDPAESVIQFGAWRTEDEVKQVVAALRQVFGGVK